MLSDDIRKTVDQAQETIPANNGVSRHSLLAGSAGLTIGGMLVAPAALAQQGRAAGPKAHHHGPSATMSDRIYSVNPSHPEMVDIAENPANVPPPIDRTEQTTVEVNLETIEIEANLDANSV